MERVTITVLFLLAAIDASASIWHVELDGSGDYTDIQPAVDAAAPGDTISIGPGRFDTFRSMDFPPWTVDTIVGVKKAGLRFTGSGQDRTFLGLASKSAEIPQVFYSDGGYDAVVENMTIENTDMGVNWENGNLVVQSCLFRGDGEHGGGIFIYKVDAIVRDCTFELLSTAVTVFEQNDSCLIDNCIIRKCRVGVEVGPWAENSVILNTTVQDVTFGFQFQMQSKGRIENCSVAALWSFAVFVGPGAAVEIANTTISGGHNGIQIEGGSVTGSNIVVKDATEAALLVNDGGLASIHRSHILPASSGWAFKSQRYDGPLTAIDLTDNYWGTTESVAIAASIYDNHLWRDLQCKVVYEPFAGSPSPTDRTSWGDVKTMFR